MKSRRKVPEQVQSAVTVTGPYVKGGPYTRAACWGSCRLWVNDPAGIFTNDRSAVSKVVFTQRF